VVILLFNWNLSKVNVYILIVLFFDEHKKGRELIAAFFI